MVRWIQAPPVEKKAEELRHLEKQQQVMATEMESKARFQGDLCR